MPSHPSRGLTPRSALRIRLLVQGALVASAVLLVAITVVWYAVTTHESLPGIATSGDDLDQAVQIARQRYAAGQITSQEYFEIIGNLSIYGDVYP